MQEQMEKKTSELVTEMIAKDSSITSRSHEIESLKLELKQLSHQLDQ